MNDESELTDAALARLADGSLDPDRAAAVRAHAGGSAELAASLAEQQRAVSLLHALSEPAPAALRVTVEAMTDRQRSRQRQRQRQQERLRLRQRPRVAIGLGGAAGLAALAAVLVVLIGGSGAPTIPQTTRLTLAAATLPSPALSRAHPGQLAEQVGGVPFPFYTDWRTAGARTDTVHGRRIVTVFYIAPGAGRVGYAIVAGAPLSVISGRTVTLAHTDYTLSQIGSARVVTWVKSGHTCVIAGRGANSQVLLSLATVEQHPAAA